MYLNLAIRLLLGVNLFFNGGIYFFTDFEIPDSAPLATRELAKAFIDSGYIMEIVKAIELLTSISLIVNRLVPFSLLVMFPITVNIIFIDFLVDKSSFSMIIGGITAVLHFILIANYASYYRGVLSIKSTPKSLF